MNLSFLAIELFVFVLFGLCLWHAVRIGRGRDLRYAASWGPLAAIVGTVIFTALLEYRLGNPTQGDTIYEYPNAFLVQGPYTLGVPLWIPLGWAFVVYAAMRTSAKLEPNWKVRPLVDGLLALNLDLSLDPIAALNGWWVWKTEQLYVFSRRQLEAAEAAVPGLDCLREDTKISILKPARAVRSAEEPLSLASPYPRAAEGWQSLENPESVTPPLPRAPEGWPEEHVLDWIPADLVTHSCRPFVEPGYAEYFGIPLRNFFAWFFIVTSFSFSFRAIRYWWLHPRGKFGLPWQLAAALLAILPSGLVLVIYKISSEAIGQLKYAPTQGVLLFTTLFMCAVVMVAWRWFGYRRNHPYDRLLFLAPLSLQAFFFYEIFVRKGYLIMPELAIFIPTTAAVGVFVFGWPYLDDMKRILREHGVWRLLRPGAGLAEHSPEAHDFDPDGIDDR